VGALETEDVIQAAFLDAAEVDEGVVLRRVQLDQGTALSPGIAPGMLLLSVKKPSAKLTPSATGGAEGFADTSSSSCPISDSWSAMVLPLMLRAAGMERVPVNVVFGVRIGGRALNFVGAIGGRSFRIGAGAEDGADIAAVGCVEIRLTALQIGHAVGVVASRDCCRNVRRSWEPADGLEIILWNSDGRWRSSSWPH